MEKTLIVANWKENLTAPQATRWLEVLSSKFPPSGQAGAVQNSKLEVVICPAFVLIPALKHQVSSIKHRVYLGAQDVSKFEEGQYTGEVSAKMLKDFVDYVIVGHSERRRYFGETDEDVATKSILALKYGLVPIVCVSNVEEARNWKLEAGEEAGNLKLDSVIFAYEPLFAVGTGTPDTPENANDFAKKVKTEVGQDVRVLYGGSVNAKNAKSFVSQPDIGGVLVGQASLDAGEFAEIVNLVTTKVVTPTERI